MKKIFLVTVLFIATAAILVWIKGARKPEVGTEMGQAQQSGKNEEISVKKRQVLPSQNDTGLPLNIPDGFSISVFYGDIPGARVAVFDEQRNIWVSQLSQGTVSKLTIKDGKVVGSEIMLRGLNEPHGIAFDPDDPGVLYIAQEQNVSKVRINPMVGNLEKIVDLPSGRGHSTRTIGFGPDGRLYVHIGSSCNVCVESDMRRATIYSMNKDGSDFRQFAKGLRNTVFFTWNPLDDKMWGTDNGRDLLGDNIPPDEINVIEEGSDYGWPYCYGQNIHDDNFDSARRVSCADKTAPKIELQAHSAPLGLAFVPESSNWPEEYKNDLLVAFHGSWNRSVPTGYKLTRIKFDTQGNYEGTEDFVSGWLGQNGSVLGRPAGVLFGQDGAMYVTDDRRGVIYRIKYGVD